MKRWQWAIAAAALLALLLIAMAFHVQAQSRNPGEAPILYEGLQLDPILLALDKKALEEAYHEQLLKLISVWLSTGNVDDARNFRNGMRNARRAYAILRDAIAAREKQIIELDRQNQDNKP